MQYIYYSPSTVFYPSIEQNGKWIKSKFIYLLL
jgi:hypothetical protein